MRYSLQIVLLCLIAFIGCKEDKKNSGTAADQVSVARPVVVGTTPVSPANNNNPIVYGTAPNLVIVKVYSDSACTTEIGTGNSNGSGQFTAMAAVADSSTTTIYAKAFNGSYSSSCSTTSVSYVEDSGVPNTPVMISVTPTGPANNNSPTVAGTADANVTIKLYTNNTCTSSVAGTGTTNGSGNFSISLTVADNSTTTYYATATDSASNASLCSTTSVTYVEDSAAPAAPTVSSTLPTSPADDNTPTIQGTAEANSTVRLYTNNTCTSAVAGTGTATAGGTFGVDATVVNNTTTTFYATATDTAGNVSGCSTTSASYNVYSIPEGMAFLSGTTTTAPATNTNFNQATAYSIRWTSGEYHSTYYSHSTTTNSHQLTVKVAGDYFVNLTVPIASATSGVAVRTQIRVNGVAIDTGRSESAYISNNNGQRESSNHSAILLPGLSANDVIDVTTIQAGTAATATVTLATLIVEKIDATRNVFFAKAEQTTNSTNLNQSTAYPLQWTDVVVGPAYTHSNIADTENIQFASSGNYLVYVNIPVAGNTASSNVKMIAKLNDVALTTGEATQGVLLGASHPSSSIHWAALIPNVTNGDILTIATVLGAATGDVTTTTGFKASIFIDQVSSTGVYFGRTTSTTLGTNFSPNTIDTIRWTTDDIKDAAYYTHSTSTNSHQITLGTAGDYLLALNVPLTSASNNVNTKVAVRIGGVAVSGAETKSALITGSGGHTDGSNSLVFLLRKTTASQVVDLTTVREGAVGSSTTSGEACLFMQYKPNSVSP